MPSWKRKLELLVHRLFINVSKSKTSYGNINGEQCLQDLCIILIATILSTLANLEGDETFEASMLGQAEEVVQERICDDELILIKK